MAEKSLPLRKCGLKLVIYSPSGTCPIVTSLAEVWIETLSESKRQ